MDTSALIAILEKGISSDKNELDCAQNYLEQAASQNLPELLKLLSDVLKHGGNSPVARMQGAIQLKNFLYSKDPATKLVYQQRWLQFPEETRFYVKRNVLETLGTETTRPSSAAQCVAYIACTELPTNNWPDLVTTLTEHITTPGSTEIMKEATLEAIGYICQDIDPEILEAQSNVILTAIVNGMKMDEPSDHVKLAATNALLNSLEFTRANFEKESERHIIMQIICESTQSPNIQIRVAALQCLVKVMSLYYQYMEFYMGPALFAITMEAMKSDIDEVSLQGIEFWSNVCDEEVDLAIELSEAQEQGRPPERTSRFYAKGAVRYLIPILTQSLTKQEEFDDDDEWNPCKAAGVCLMLLASCCEDDVVTHVLPFITDNINSADWKFKDAAIMTFGSILEGPNTNILKPLVEQAMPVLIERLKDPSIVVRDTTAWTVGRVCEIIPEVVISETFLRPMLAALLEGLTSEPRVSANVCWAFSSLAEAAYEAANEADAEAEPSTYVLSFIFENVIEKLLATTDRVDGNQHNLRSAAYEALMEMIKNSPKDCYATVQQTTLIILEKLNRVLQYENHVTAISDRAQLNDLQSLLCATLQSVMRKVTPEDAPKISDQMMGALLQMLSGVNGRAGGVQEDALLAVSTLVEVLGDNFMKYMEAFKPFLITGLKNHEEHQVCQAAVGVTGDVCRALTVQIMPFADEIMLLLLEKLGDNNVHRSIKPQILGVFGDLALAIGPEFKNYLEVVLQTLNQASNAQVDKSDYDMIEYLNELRESCLEAYTGIIQGLKGTGTTPNADIGLLNTHVPNMVQFIRNIALEEDHSDQVIAAACGVIGDLCTAFGLSILGLLDIEPLHNLLTKARRSKSSKTKTLATWATREIRKLKNEAASS